MKILVTGATSLIGKEVISLLLKSGHEVRSLTRQKTIPAILKKTEVWTFDLTELPNEIAADIDTVIHIAAATPDANSTAEDYSKTNIDGTKKLLFICEQNKVKRLIYISSVVVLYDEYNDNYTLSKKAAEAMIIESNLNWTILRPAEILGTDKSWNKFLSLLKMKKFVFIPGNGRQLRHPVFYKDVVQSLLKVLNNPNTFQKKYNLAAAKPITYFEYLNLVKKIFKLKFSIILVPVWFIKFVSLLSPVLPRRFSKKIKNTDSTLKDFSFDIQNAIHDFNYTPFEMEHGIIDLKTLPSN